MGAKASTPATSGHQSPRSRTFSSSSTGIDASAPSSAETDGVANEPGQGFNLLRSLPGLQVQHHVQNSSVDRQRARSLSSMPDMQSGTQHPAVVGQNSQNISANSNSSSQRHHANYTVQQRQTLGDGGIRVGVPVGSSSFHGHSLILNGGGGERGIGPQSHALNFDDMQEVSIAGANFVESFALAASASSGRVYTATSLPSHIWSLNGIKCPVCNKFVLPDDIECHLVMCLTKPRLSYNEDVLSDSKGECVICLEDLNPGDIIARLPCLCVYHKGCIDRWFEVNRSCPEHPGD